MSSLTIPYTIGQAAANQAQSLAQTQGGDLLAQLGSYARMFVGPVVGGAAGLALAFMYTQTWWASILLALAGAAIGYFIGRWLLGNQ